MTGLTRQDPEPPTAQQRMRAVQCTGYGPPEVLRLMEKKRPTPGNGEVLVRVVATTVHAGDVRIRAFDVPRGQRVMARLVLGMRRPKHPVLGMELAGVVEAVGPGVTGYCTGDEVVAFTGWGLGAYAEYRCLTAAPRKSAAKQGLLAAKPPSMTFEEAAAGLATGAITALRLLRKAQVRPGQEVLVYGASGSAGTYAVQLAKHFGARVTGVCSTTNLELVRSLGAATVIDYTRHDFTEDQHCYDVILDAVDKLAQSRAKGRLKPAGIYLNVVKDSGRAGGGTAEDLAFLCRLAEQGGIRAVIDRSYPIEQIVQAHRYVDEGHKRGHVVITVGTPAAKPA